MKIDKLWVVVPLGDGKRRLAVGAALSVDDVLADRELSRDEVAGARRPAVPAWATHVVTKD